MSFGWCGIMQSFLFRLRNKIYFAFDFILQVRRFRSIFNDRRVAIVGGAPNIAGRGLGEGIDSHDLVVRLNLMLPDGRESDLGSRTDVRFIGCTLLEKHIPYFSRLEVGSVVMSTDKNFCFFKDQGRSVCLFHRDVPFIALWWMRRILGVKNLRKPPRSGIVFLFLILKLSRPRSVRLYGFSRQGEGGMEVLDYRTEGVIQYDSDLYVKNHCDAASEIELLSVLQKAGLVDFGVN